MYAGDNTQGHKVRRNIPVTINGQNAHCSALPQHGRGEPSGACARIHDLVDLFAEDPFDHRPDDVGGREERTCRSSL